MASSQKTAVDIDITAEEEDEAMYGHGPLTKEELEQKYVKSPFPSLYLSSQIKSPMPQCS